MSEFPFLNDIDESMNELHQFIHGFDSQSFLLPTKKENRLLVHENEQDADIAVCIQKDILERLKNLSYPNDFCLEKLPEWAIIFEELSHFHHYCHHALRNQPLSSLELEVQAELDKLYCILEALEHKNQKGLEDKVFSILFDELKLGEWVDEQEAVIYKRAHDEARKIGRQIFSQARDFDDLKRGLKAASLASQLKI